MRLAPSDNTPVSLPARVLALYYGWYATPAVSGQWEHYGKVDEAARTIDNHVHYPLLGPYDSTDGRVLQQHARMAVGAGIDTLVCSWWGRDDQTDRSLRAFLPVAARAGLTLCPLYEQAHGSGDPSTVWEDWRYLLDQYAGSRAFLRVNGKPVIFVYQRAMQRLKPNDWADLRRHAEKAAPPGVFVIGDGGDTSSAGSSDGAFLCHPWGWYKDKPLSAVAATFDTIYGPLLGQARRSNALPVLNIAPGFDDRIVPILLERQGGAFYQAQWEAALRHRQSAWLLVNSFNLWHSGSEIEPSAELGRQYLNLTRSYAARFKGR